MPKLRYNPIILEEELEFLDSLESMENSIEEYLNEQVRSGNLRDEEFIKKYMGDE